MTEVVSIKGMTLVEAVKRGQYTQEDMIAARATLSELIVAGQERAKEEFKARMLAEARKLGIEVSEINRMLAVTPQKVGTKKESVETRKKPENKYRNPKNHAEVWQGRGLKPKWMTREIEAAAEKGITLTKEYFLMK